MRRDVNSPRSQPDCILHPLIYTSAPSESSTKCGSGFFRVEVWIEVCNPQSDVQVRASETTDFEGGHPGAHLISIERHKERQLALMERTVWSERQKDQ